MSKDYSDFDAEKLLIRKDNYSDFKFCPRCSTELVEDTYDHRLRLGCPNEKCDYLFYQNPIPAAGAVIVEDNKILLVKRAHPPKIGWWCLPAGFMEWDEHPSQTAVREVKEETGLDIRLNGLFNIYSGSDDPRNNAILILYLADITGGKMEAKDDALEVAFFSFDNIPEKLAFESHVETIKDYREKFDC